MKYVNKRKFADAGWCTMVVKPIYVSAIRLWCQQHTDTSRFHIERRSPWLKTDLISSGYIFHFEDKEMALIIKLKYGL